MPSEKFMMEKYDEILSELRHFQNTGEYPTTSPEIDSKRKK
ncbi:hypothetical protein KSZ_32030 [Dictyobacter formicarum]|uniref:Uncharacterized protein n=1 Tax=Dictyobacter formicarum TaxID=2778368 RepID=A0ABQ3VG93_9CHLR|nr:hypothetical protein KSZ_32030 [Dictyobacter formicarum]